MLENQWQNFCKFIKRNSKITITVIFLFVFFAITALVITFHEISSIPKPLTKSKIKADKTFVQTDSFFTPSAKALTEDYYFYRQEKSVWTKEEIEENFTEPDEKWVNSLKEANRQKVNKILGAAP